MSKKGEKETAKEQAIMQTLGRLKSGTPIFQSFIKTAYAYEKQMRSMIQIGQQFCEALDKIGDNFRGDLQEGIKRMAESQREIERRRLEMSDHLLREVIQPLGRAIDSENRYEIPAFEREYGKRKKKIGNELGAAEAITKKTGKKAKNVRPEDLQKNIKLLTEKVKELDKLRSDSLRRVMLMERKRGCDFLRMFTRVAEMQLFQFTEGYNILNDNRDLWADLSVARDTLPEDDEQLLAAVSAVTAERTFVPLQTAAAQQGIQGSAAGPPPPSQYQSYDEQQQQPPPPAADPYAQQYDPPQQQYQPQYDDYGQGAPIGDDLPPPPPADFDDGFAARASEILTKQPQCIALFEYVAQRPDELNLQVDDIITILREDEGWWQGENAAGLTGLFPSNFVERI